MGIKEQITLSNGVGFSYSIKETKQLKTSKKIIKKKMVQKKRVIKNQITFIKLYQN